jgi:hypothetical protein
MVVHSQQLWKAAGCALVLAACAPAARDSGAGFMPAAPSEKSTVVVRNDYFGEMDVYIVAGATRTRLGSVPTAGTASFRIPGVLLLRTEIQFQVDPVGPVPPFTYQSFQLRPGNDVELAVAPALTMSSYSIVVNH